MESQSFDIIVVGGGPGGYVAAIRSAQLGFKTALVEQEHLGGICLNWGCIPTKALLRSAEVYRQMKHASDYGFKVPDINIDLKQIVKRSRDASSRLNQGVGYLLKKNGVAVFNGPGKLAGPRKIDVQMPEKKLSLEGRHIILATGARPLQLKGMEADGKQVVTYKEAIFPETMPESLLVVGGGAIGIEFASFYNEMGVEVTLVEALPQLLPGADADISKNLEKSLINQGIKIRTSTHMKSMDKKQNIVTTVLEKNEKMERVTTKRVLLAMGVLGNVEGIGLEDTKVKVSKNIIQTYEWMQTDEEGIYAIGDVAGPPCLAHKASHEGVLCVEKIAGLSDLHAIDRQRIPYCTYSHPQVAGIGLTEKQAQERGLETKSGTFPFVGNGKAIALGESEGMTKTIFDAKSGELLGAHMIGAQVTEMIQGFAVAMNLETTEESLIQTIFPHPTISETMHESVLATCNRAIHI